MAEYVCPLCKACFFEATDLQVHVAAAHREATEPEPEPPPPQPDPLFEASTPTLPQVHGSGIHLFTEALADLTEAQDARAFLQEAGTPVVHLPGWPPPTQS